MNESVHATQVDECTECNNARDATLADLADLEVAQEVVALSALVCFEQCATRQHNVVACAIQLEDLCSDALTNIRSEVTNTTHLNKRRWQEATQTDVDDKSTLDNFDDQTFNGSVNFFNLLDVSPCTLVLSALLRQQQTTFFVLKCDDKSFNLLAQLDDGVWIDVCAH